MELFYSMEQLLYLVLLVVMKKLLFGLPAKSYCSNLRYSTIFMVSGTIIEIWFYTQCMLFFARTWVTGYDLSIGKVPVTLSSWYLIVDFDGLCGLKLI